VLYRCAKQDRDRRFHVLYDKVARSDVMRRAWGEVRANRGAPGVDGITIDDVIASGVDEFLEELAARLRAGTYRPRPLRRVHIPKPGKPGQTRPLGIPCVADRVVMAAAKIVLEPIFEADFVPSSYGFRPGLSAHHALETVRTTVNAGRVWALDADIRSCFDEIETDALVAQIEPRVCDRRMLKLLKGWLRAGVFEGGIVSAIEAGTPQGSPISPLLANIALHMLDEAWAGGGQRLGTLVRYCDLCRRRHKSHYADLRVMPSRNEECLQRASSAAVFVGIIETHPPVLAVRGGGVTAAGIVLGQLPRGGGGRPPSPTDIARECARARICASG
jgi:group II intron reverse transcriptase/maturase